MNYNKEKPEAWNTRKDALIDFNELSEFYDEEVANERALFDDRLPANFKRTGTLGRGRRVFEHDESDDDDDDDDDDTHVQPDTPEYESALQEQLRKAVGPGYSNELIHHHFGTNTYQIPSQPAISESEFLQNVTDNANKSVLTSLCERVTRNLQVINEDSVSNATSNCYSSDEQPYRNRRRTTDSEYSSNTSSHLKSISEDDIIDYNSFVNKYSESGITTNTDKFAVSGGRVEDGDSVTPESVHKDLDDFVLPISDFNTNSFLNPQSPEFKPNFSREYSGDMIDFNVDNASFDKFNVNASEWLPNKTKISDDKLSNVENSTKKRKGKKQYQNITTEIDFQHIRNLETNEYNKIPIKETFISAPLNVKKTKKQSSSFDERLNPSAQSFVYNCFSKQNADTEISISSKTEFPPLS